MTTKRNMTRRNTKRAVATYNGHIWLSPANAKAMAAEIAVEACGC